ICGAQLTVAAPTVRLTSSPVSLVDLGEHRGRGPGWGQDNDDLPPAVVITGRRRGTKRARPRAITVNTREPPPSSTVVLLATDRTGWANLTRLITAGRRRCDKGEAIVAWSEIAQHAAGLIALWGGEGSLLADEPEPPPALIGELRDAFGDRLYAMLTRHRQADDIARERRLRARAAAAGLPIIAA